MKINEMKRYWAIYFVFAVIVTFIVFSIEWFNFVYIAAIAMLFFFTDVFLTHQAIFKKGRKELNPIPAFLMLIMKEKWYIVMVPIGVIAIYQIYIHVGVKTLSYLIGLQSFVLLNNLIILIDSKKR